MSLFSKLAGFWSGRFTSAVAAKELAQGLRRAAPDLPWVVEPNRSGTPSFALPGRLIVTLQDCREGVRAQLIEPGQPGDDDPPVLLRGGYDVTNLVHALAWRARIVPGTVVLFALRRNACYEVVQGFTDHHGSAVAEGTRLTFVQREFLPYHGGHTLTFHERTIYLQEDDEVCRQFERYFAVAKPR
ncbi:MAG: DUF3601 domain-containing protein [Planctomycetota bacterium]